MTDRLGRLFPCLLIVPAVLPLVYVSGVVYPYVAPKTFLLQGTGIIAIAAFSYLALSGRSFFYDRLRQPFAWIPVALLIVEYVASLFGIGFYHSFWGLFERGDGLLTSTVITAFFYLILLSADRAFLARLAKTIAVVAGTVAFIAVLQWATASFGGKAWFLPPVSGRIGSTLGNAAFLAGYLGIALFVILYALRDAAGAWRRILGIAALFSVAAIFFAATRGTLLALVLTFLVALAYAAMKGEGSIRELGRKGLFAAAVLVMFFFAFRTELTHAPFESVRRMASISLSEGTVSSRLFVWKHIGEEALKRPFSGYGAEQVAHLFDKAYDPSAISEQWFDRSHNAFLDYFAQYGIFGLASYLALIGAFAVSALRLYRRFPQGITNPGVPFLLLIFTYAVQNFFVFDTPASLWLIYALFAALLVLLSETQATRLTTRAIPRVVPQVVAGAIMLLLIPTVITPLRANILLTKGYLLHLVDVERANTYFERGLALGTYADFEYGYQAYDIYTDHQVVQLKGENLVAAYEYALSVLTANFKKYPYDARTATYLGHVMDTAPAGVAIDESLDRQALDRAIELSPLRAQAWYMMANIALRKADALPQDDPKKRGSFQEALDVLERYAGLEPTLPTPGYTLATLYYKLGDSTSAKMWADKTYPLYTIPDTSAAAPAVKYYLAIGDWPHAARFLADLVAENPSDFDVLYDLAKVTYLAGDPAAAARIVAQLRTSAPGLVETDRNFLAAITPYEQSGE